MAQDAPRRHYCLSGPAGEFGGCSVTRDFLEPFELGSYTLEWRVEYCQMVSPTSGLWVDCGYAEEVERFRYCRPPCSPDGMGCYWHSDCCSYSCDEDTHTGVVPCEDCPQGWVCFNGICTEGSPIVVDVFGNGFNPSAAEGVAFDITGDGENENLSWTTASSEVVWLALDRN